MKNASPQGESRETNDVRSLTGRLYSYTLPDSILPLAPRQPFRRFSPAALKAMAELVLARPEKRGMMSHAIRMLNRERELPLPRRWVTIEAHFDAASVPPELADRLITLGFELDGFHTFVPIHYREHFTLKYKLDRSAVGRRRDLKSEIDQCSTLLKDELVRSWPGVEAYIETEVYTERDRRKWVQRKLDPEWKVHWPVRDERFTFVNPPQTQFEAARIGLDIKLVKRCDIHAKLDRNLSTRERIALINAFGELGFYNVRTWAGNDVCTGQFAQASAGREIFDKLIEVFDAAGGCSEMTLEYVPSVWRASYLSGESTSLARLPPLIV